MTEPSVLVQKRGRVKGTLTRIKSFADNISESTSLEDIIFRLEKIEEAWMEFKKIEDNLLSFPNQDSEIEEFENKYFETRGLLTRARNSREGTFTLANSTTMHAENPQNGQPPNFSFTNNENLSTIMSNFLSSQQTFFENLVQSSPNSSKLSTSDVRLPRLQIPNFSGDFKQWPSFADLFETSVHSNPHLNACQKLQYLKGLLHGEAASIIRHLTITESNYTEAWEKLKQRYDKKRLITTAMIKTFFDVYSVNQASAKHLRNLHDIFDEVIRGLRALGENAQKRDPWLIYIALTKLDPETKQLWSKESSQLNFPDFQDFLKFLNTRCEALEISVDMTKKQNPVKTLHASSIPSVSNCLLCDNKHNLYQCDQFLAKSAEQRKGFVVREAVCFNCLRPGHSVKACRSRYRCNFCKRSHHTLLHEVGKKDNQHLISASPKLYKSSSIPNVHSSNSAWTSNQNSDAAINSISPSSKQNILSFNSLIRERMNQVESMACLPTALVRVEDNLGQSHLCRILLDCGSQVSFVAESFVQRLALNRTHAKLAISGIASVKTGFTKGKVRLQMSAPFDKSKRIVINAYIMSKLTSQLPPLEFDTNNWEYLKNRQLADPYFNKPATIDAIVGADKFFEIIRDGKLKQGEDYPVAQETIFGWVLAGKYPASNHTAMTFNTLATADIDTTLKRFWECEELMNNDDVLTIDEELCEQHFKANSQRDSKGRFVVSLPFKHQSIALGDSLSSAIKRFQSVERRFQKDQLYHDQYSRFMQEYLELGHMEVIPEDEVSLKENSRHFYLPHHAVFKNSPTPKIRVVFDGSSKTSTGVSLNDNLLVGGVVQRDLFSILISFRKHEIAFSADIEKMYRQIRMSEKDQDYQRIIWRRTPTDELQHFRLCTVTYGTSSAPYLATRVLKQVALDHDVSHPLVSSIIRNNFYVDDLLSGASSVKEALKIRDTLTEILRNNGFNLTKWKSNCPALIPIPHTEESLVHIDDTSQITKVLGVVWNFQEDTFSFHITSLSNATPTKRRLLSESSRIFDPLGFLAPTTVSIKIMFQQLWLLNLNWDDPLPHKLSAKWNDFKSSLNELTKLRIPRQMCSESQRAQLHGFSDASELAFSAAVYCRTLNKDGTIIVRLVAAKTKVAPLKQVSLPRLELCAALLLARLMIKIVKSLSPLHSDICAWTDSQIVLSWLSDTPRRWKSYVGNRTSEILDLIPRKEWRYVPSSDNPADQASRGISPLELIQSKLWWNGPSWLQEDYSDWPPDNVILTGTNVDERKNPIIFNQQEISDCLVSLLLTQCSSWTKILRVLVHCIRFINNCRPSKSISKEIGPIKGKELRAAENFIIKLVQLQTFSVEIKCLTQGKELPVKSHLVNLHPFLDGNQLLRVGGRLQNSNLSYGAKHPVILPKNHEISKLIVKDMHARYLHPGVELLISIIRQKYWIIRIRDVVKKITHSCISCFRHRIKINNQLMGNLPAHRVIVGRPFLRSGVDFAGPINLRNKIGRGSKVFKAYIALFVCFSTKALHLEIVNSLSSDAFLAALRRFVARRGMPTDLYSDNGGNFVGASRKLLILHNQALHSFSNSPLITAFISDSNISWHFIPPVSPHFGGLWEAGVKAVKSHLHRVIGETTLTYEEMLTLLVQIEAILNSRPLCQLSESPESLDVLTPSHFLIGEPLTSIPEPNLQEDKISRLGHWQQIQAMTQGFWKRWSRDYLTTLQQRPKWKRQQRSLQRNDLVILTENNIPPSKWVVGRIEDIHPGTDGIVRVVTVKTLRGIYKRSISKVHRLPLEE